MALKDLLNKKNRNKEVEVNKDHIKEHLKDYQKIIAYWRKYPDKFVDYLCSLNPDNQFRFYLSQRIKIK